MVGRAGICLKQQTRGNLRWYVQWYGSSSVILGAHSALNLPHVAQPAWKYINHFNSKHNSIVLTSSIFVSCSVFLYISSSMFSHDTLGNTDAELPVWKFTHLNTHINLRWTHCHTDCIIIIYQLKTNQFFPHCTGFRNITKLTCVISLWYQGSNIWVFLYSLLQFILECMTKSDP